MDDISVVTITRPVSANALAQEVERIQAERMAEITDLETLLDAQEDKGEPQSVDWAARLEELRAIDGTHDADAILAANKIKIAVRSVSRKQAFRRGDLIEDARQWFVDATGLEVDEAREAAESEEGVTAFTMLQAADIMVAIVPDMCEGWDVPDTQIGWCDVKDWIFVPLLNEVWALNPQFVVSQGEL